MPPTIAARLVALLLCLSFSGPQAVQAPSPFATQIASLSEPGGYFDTDNLISNESSYLQIVQELETRKVRGGAYIGVGPDQNFSYIAAVRPSVAFILDVRRDNMLLHLLFKALFAASRTRVEYLAQLTGRAVPADLEPWRAASIDRLVAYVDGAPVRGTEPLRRALDTSIASMGVPLSAQDRATIDRFHRRFIAEGLSLRFQSTGRPPQYYNPAYRDLLTDRDGSGRQRNYLASEDAFQFVKQLQARDQVIPVTGDLSGPSALVAIGRALAARKEHVSALYVSNVEFYLFRAGTFAKFAANVAHLPHAPNSVVIRSIFGRLTSPARPSDSSVSRLQGLDEFLHDYDAGRIRQYADVVR